VRWEAASAIAIGNNIGIGAGAIVCPEVTVGDNSVIGAGSVVTKDVPAHLVVVGNPCRVIREVP
jgi:maltose O-acetyltransferase